MIEEPLVSVVLPVYNGEQYLAEAIDSILKQTFENFELIMIDDGSTDSSAQILSAYQQRDRRIRVIIRENRGLATTLNDSIDMARGAWIARIDQDDIALPNRLERQLEWLTRTGADISGSWVQRFGSPDKRVVRLCQTDQAIKMAMLFYSPFAHPSVMMRSRLAKQLRYDKAWEKAEDYDLWERAAEAGWKMTNVPEVLLLYRVHAEQTSILSANYQHQLTLKIRRRYATYMRLSQSGIDGILKSPESPLSEIEMGAVDALFTGLLQQNHEESRKVIFDNATRFYFKSAASCPDIVLRWGKLNREFGEGFGVVTQFKLWIFRLLRIRTDGYLFKQLKKIYLWKMSKMSQ